MQLTVALVLPTLPLDKPQEILVEARVARHFGMKGGAQQMILAHCHNRSVIKCCQYFNAFFD